METLSGITEGEGTESKGPPSRTAVLLINLGTPESPTPRAIRKFLRAFLSDRRVVDIPRMIWWIILNAIVLPHRSFKLAKLYQTIWTQKGSPLRFYSESLAEQLNERLSTEFNKFNKTVTVYCGMTYGNPKY